MISKRKITSEHIHCISEFLEENQGRWVTVKSIMEHLHNKQILQAISTTTVRAILKHQLNKTYKKVDVVNQTGSIKENVRKLCESVMIANLLDENGFELIYVDEFTCELEATNTTLGQIKELKDLLIWCLIIFLWVSQWLFPRTEFSEY